MTKQNEQLHMQHILKLINYENLCVIVDSISLVNKNVRTAGQTEFRVSPLEDGVSTSFSSKMAQEEAMLYRLSPLAKSETLDDLFSWLDDMT